MQTDLSSKTDAAEPSPATIFPPREQFAKPWCWLTVVAGLPLGATFFIPFTPEEAGLCVHCPDVAISPTIWSNDGSERSNDVPRSD
jgi:hypothetical protein